MNIPFNYAISTDGTISVNVKGKMTSFAPDHAHYNDVKEACRAKDMSVIEKLADLPQAIQDYANGNIAVKSGVVTFKGRIVANSLTQRIVKLMREGFPFEPMLLFLENLMENTSMHTVQEIYNFLQNRNLPITDDGCFLAYKSVTEDGMDWHTKTVKNEVGVPVTMPRNEVDDNWREACSSGFHVGTIDYLQNFHNGEGKILIVKVNPKDVVACDGGGAMQKCRTCAYTPIGLMTEELAKEVYATTQNSFTPVEPSQSAPPIWPDDEDEDEEYDDEEDFDEGFDDEEDDDDY